MSQAGASESGIVIPQDLGDRIDTALDDGVPMILAYVNAQGTPRLSFRGSTHVYGPDQLAIWVRNPEGGLLTALPNNHHLTLLYRNAEARVTVTFYGRGHVEEDQAVRDVMFDRIPEIERKADPNRKGVALIIDLDLIQGRNGDGPINMARS